MIRIFKSKERGQADHGWLQAQHAFSFANYYDPERMGFGVLRVLNEDRIAPGAGFPRHPHRDMEILTYVIEGGLEHRDSMGNGAVIQAGEFQLMSAGCGLEHSEANASKSEPLHLLQIWLFPARRGIVPGYEQKRFDDRVNKLRRVVGPDTKDGALKIHQDVEIFSAILGEGVQVEHRFQPERAGWIQAVRGILNVNGQVLEAGDGAEVSIEDSLELLGKSEAEFLLFDMPLQR